MSSDIFDMAGKDDISELVRLRTAYFICITLCVFILIGCGKTEPEYRYEDLRALPSRSDFENLDKDLSVDQIIEQFGNCGYEGSGIIYHVWKLDDGSKAKLVFNSNGKIEFIYIVTEDSSERIYDRDH